MSISNLLIPNKLSLFCNNIDVETINNSPYPSNMVLSSNVSAQTISSGNISSINIPNGSYYVVIDLGKLSGSYTKGAEPTISINGNRIDLESHLVNSTSSTEYFEINEPVFLTSNGASSITTSVDTSASPLVLNSASITYLLIPYN